MSMFKNASLEKIPPMPFGSNRRNIEILNFLFVASAALGLVYFDFTLLNLLVSVVCFYLLNICGIYMVLHRYYSHRTFKFKNNFLKNIFTALAVLAARGSVIGWVYIHRKHHAASDTDQDPHSPKFLGFRLLSLSHYKKLDEEKMQVFLIRDVLSKGQLFVHKYYLLIILAFAAALGAVSLEWLYFAYILPGFLVHLSQVSFNYFGHTSGYRNFETSDDSRNNAWLFPFIWGEAWHNNHHHAAAALTTKVRHYEWDPLQSIITVLKK